MIPPSNPERMSGPTSPADILRAARAKIDTPDKWIRGWFARDQYSDEVDDTDEAAVCFCALGAIGSVTAGNSEGYGLACEILGNCIPDSSVDLFNDSHTHAEVLDAFDRAIALAEQGGAS